MRFAFSIAVTVAFVLLQSTVAHEYMKFKGVIPDLSLIAIIFLANKNGKILGETSGFAAGLVEDILSTSSLGFHAIIKTLMGFLAGSTFGVIFMGSLFMPMLMTGVATILKCLLTSVLVVITSEPGITSFFSLATLIEVGYNMVLAPFIFALLGFLKVLVPGVRN